MSRARCSSDVVIGSGLGRHETRPALIGAAIAKPAPPGS
jgi:hypothetical protein